MNLINIFLTAVIVPFFTLTATAQISFNGFGFNNYITDAAIDTVSGITGIPDGYTAIGFSVSATVKGFTQTIESRSARLNAAQRQLMHAVKPGAKIYIDEILIKNNRTHKISSEPVITLIKDGVTAGIDGNKILAYPGTHSTDTTIFRVSEFEIESIRPDFIYHIKISGNEIDSSTYAQITRMGYRFTVNNIIAEEIATGRKEEVRQFSVTDDGSYRYICRSKGYLTKKNAKINFVYPMPTVIDSVKGNCITDKGDEDFSFNGDIITKDAQKIIKRVTPFSIISFSVYYNNHEEIINVMALE